MVVILRISKSAMLKWLKGARQPPPVGSWAVFHPTVTVTAARTPRHHLNVQLSPHATFLQTRTLAGDSLIHAFLVLSLSLCCRCAPIATADAGLWL